MTFHFYPLMSSFACLPLTPVPIQIQALTPSLVLNTLCNNVPWMLFSARQNLRGCPALSCPAACPRAHLHQGALHSHIFSDSTAAGFCASLLAPSAETKLPCSAGVTPSPCAPIHRGFVQHPLVGCNCNFPEVVLE